MTSPLPSRVRAWRIPLTSAATLAIGLLFIALDAPFVSDPPLLLGHVPWVQAGLLALACLVLLAKRRAPFSVLAATAVLSCVDLALGGGIGMLLALIDAIYSTVLHTSDRGRRVLLALVAGLAVGATLLVLALTGDLRMTALTGLQLFAIVGTPYWWGLAVQRERARAALEAARADDLERLAAMTQQDVVREERARMARDLHDAIASELAAIAIHTEAALAAPTAPRSSLETIRAASVRSLEQMRSMILVLRSGGESPSAPDRVSDAEGIVERARQRGLQVSLEGTLPAMAVATDQAAGRILQESLTNAMKHAPGSPVTVHISHARGAMALRIDSAMDVSGRLAAPPSAGLGVRMMRERALALGGDLSAGPDDIDPGGGRGDANGRGRGAGDGATTEGGARWTVRATLPLRS
ncbi:sensor histidine kinase [Agrococcus sp. Marseille-P2731]|uniref:sensor histidine kinase n=1 Tax=Agrococcus sp. Marseille-P2731 TaxID=1841862 RepID=UPI0011608816|nr:histidine kinase [Agrococcus sp. Marseille-P2731]